MARLNAVSPETLTDFTETLDSSHSELCDIVHAAQSKGFEVAPTLAQIAAWSNYVSALSSLISAAVTRQAIDAPLRGTEALLRERRMALAKGEG